MVHIKLSGRAFNFFGTIDIVACLRSVEFLDRGRAHAENCYAVTELFYFAFVLSVAVFNEHALFVEFTLNLLCPNSRYEIGVCHG